MQSTRTLVPKEEDSNRSPWGRIKISEEIILYYYPHNVLLIILSLFTQCIIPKLA
jgi:hypothetical protein